MYRQEQYYTIVKICGTSIISNNSLCFRRDICLCPKRHRFESPSYTIKPNSIKKKKNSRDSGNRHKLSYLTSLPFESIGTNN